MSGWCNSNVKSAKIFYLQIGRFVWYAICVIIF